MSHDPQSPTDAADFDDDDRAVGRCQRCNDTMTLGELNVEAFELTGQVLCEGCAGEVFEEMDDDS